MLRRMRVLAGGILLAATGVATAYYAAPDFFAKIAVFSGAVTPSDSRTDVEALPAAQVETHAVSLAQAAQAVWLPEGQPTLDAFVDGALGDPQVLKHQVTLLLEAMAQDERWQDPVLAAQAAVRVRQAAVATLSRAYYAPIGFSGTMALPKGSLALDFVKTGAGGATAFQAITSGKNPDTDTDTVTGTGIGSSVELPQDLIAEQDAQGQGVFASSLLNVTQIKTALPSGDYRVVLLSRGLAQGAATPYPFGVQVLANGKKRVLVETDITEKAGWIELGARGLVTHVPEELGVAKAPGQDAAEQNTATQKVMLRQIAPHNTGIALVVPVRVEGGMLQLRLTPHAQSPIVLAGLVVVHSAQSEAQAAISRILTAALSTITADPSEAARLIAQAEQTHGDPAPASVGNQRVVRSAVTLAQAVEGAKTGHPIGLQALSAYMQETAGDIDRITARTKAVLAAAGVSAYMPGTVRTRVEAAARAALNGAYITRAQIRRDLQVRNGYAFDFIQPGKAGYFGFGRVELASASLSGSDMALVDIAPWRSNFTTEGIRGVSQIRLKVPNGAYRVYLYSPKLYKPGGDPRSFGGGIKVEGTTLKPVDLRARQPEIWLRHGAPRLMYIGGMEGTMGAGAPLKDAPGQVLVKAPAYLGPRAHCGLVMSTRATVEDGDLVIDLEPGAGGEKPTIAGVIITPDNPEKLDNVFAEPELAALEPAAGGKGGPAEDAGLPNVEPAAGTPARPGFAFLPQPQFANPNNGGGVAGRPGARPSFSVPAAPPVFGGGGGSFVPVSDPPTPTVPVPGDAGGSTGGGGTSGGATSGGDGSSTGGGTSGGATSGGGTSGGGTSGGTTSGGDGGSTGGGTSGGATSGGGTSGGATSGGGTSGGGTSGGTTSGGDGGSTGGGTSGGATSGGGGSTSGGIVEVSEPSTLLISFSGIVLLAALHRRRRKR
jgi:hypothetical protein